MDIIERLWIAHSELPGRQLLMRDAITEIQSLREEVTALENRCRSYADIALDNDRLRDENANLDSACKIAGRRNEELREALKDLCAAFVNPGDGGQFEAGEVPALDKARALLNTESEL